MKRFMNCVMLLMVIILVIPGVSSADVYMKQKQHTDASQVMGMMQPARDVVSEIWMTDRGFRSDEPGHSTIMLADEQKMISIDHNSKTYMEQPLNLDKMVEKMSKDKSANDKAAMKQMMQKMMTVDATVTETGEKKTINNWKCQKYIAKFNIAMGKITNEIWATQDLKVDKKIYEQMATRMMSAMPGLHSSMESIKKEMDKVKGVQVMTISTFTMMNQAHKTTTELLEFKEGKAPADLFKIPAGYKKQEMQY